MSERHWILDTKKARDSVKMIGVVIATIVAAIVLCAQLAQAQPRDLAGPAVGRTAGSQWMVAQDVGRDGAMLPEPQGEFRRGFRRRQLDGAPGPGADAAGGLEGAPLRRWQNGAAGQGPGRFSQDFGGMPGRRFPGQQRLGQPGMAGPMRQGQVAGGRFGGMAINLKALGLSDEQKQRIREMRSRNSGKARELRMALKDKRAEMRQMMFDPNATGDQIRDKRRELRKTQDRMEEMQIEDFLSMRSVLTPEQRQRLPDIMPGNQQAQSLPPP